MPFGKSQLLVILFPTAWLRSNSFVVFHLFIGLSCQSGNRFDGSYLSAWLEFLPRDTQFVRGAQGIFLLYETNVHV